MAPHLWIADSTEELLAMADRIGVARQWLQKPGTPQEHFDICLTKRGHAVAAGAIPVTQRALAALIRARRAGVTTPATYTSNEAT